MSKPPVKIAEALRKVTPQQRAVVGVHTRIKTKAKSYPKPSEKKPKEKTPKTPIKTISQPKPLFQFLDCKGLRDYRKIRVFIEWCAISEDERKPKTQREFAEVIGVNPDTLSDWKKREGFFDEVDKLRDQWFRKYVTEIDYAMVKAAKAGNPKAAEIFYKRYGYLVEKHVVEQQPDFDENEDKLVRTSLANIGLAGLLKELEREETGH